MMRLNRLLSISNTRSASSYINKARHNVYMPETAMITNNVCCLHYFQRLLLLNVNKDYICDDDCFFIIGNASIWEKRMGIFSISWIYWWSNSSLYWFNKCPWNRFGSLCSVQYLKIYIYVVCLNQELSWLLTKASKKFWYMLMHIFLNHKKKKS